MRYTHLACLKTWARERGSGTCEICRRPYSEALKAELRADIDAGLQAKQARQPRPAAAAVPPPGADLGQGRGQPGGSPRARVHGPEFWIRLALLLTLLIGLAVVLIYLGMKASCEGETRTGPTDIAAMIAPPRGHCTAGAVP